MDQNLTLRINRTHILKDTVFNSEKLNLDKF